MRRALSFHWLTAARASVVVLMLASAFLVSCYSLRPSSGAGQTSFTGPRVVDAGSVIVPTGYRIEVVAQNLTFPTGVTFDAEGHVYVTESGYSYGEVFTEPRLLRVEAHGALTVIASSESSGPWTGVTYHEGNFYIADGNVRTGGRLLRISLAGQTQVLLSDLPSLGDHHTNGPLIGPDAWIYFGQGTATNAGVVGPDNFDYGWLKRHPQFHDRPAADVTLRGENFESPNVLQPDSDSTRSTGAFLPYGTASQRGQVIRGSPRPTGAILRIRPDATSGEPEVVAWGLRNPFSLAFAPEGSLFVTENGSDDRGSRPVWGAPDVLWRINPGTWYGWPDYVAGEPIIAPQFRSPGKPAPQFLLASHPNPVRRPVARFSVHSSANGFDFSRGPFGHAEEAFVAIFGDLAPAVGKVLGPLGGKVVRVDPRTGVITDFAVNRADQEGPASKVGGSGFERPIAARFDAAGQTIYVVDFGVMTLHGKTPQPVAGSGVLWRIIRKS